MSGVAQNKKTCPYARQPEPDAVDISDTATSNCQYFNIATDSPETAPTNSTDTGKLEELWLPGSQSCRAGNSYYGALEDGRDLYVENLLQNTSQFAQQLDVQIKALMLGNSVVEAACDTDSILYRLLSTIFRDALAASSIAKQYARATNAIRVEICSALRTCRAQCARLCQARQTYMSSLYRLKKVHKNMLVHQQACVLCKGSLLNDLVELEKLRCTAKRLQESCHLIESMKLIKQREACRKILGQMTSGSSSDLDNHFLAEKAALQLVHASRLLNMEEIVSVFRQGCPIREQAARKILQRVEQAVPNECRPCTQKRDGEEPELQHGGVKAAVLPTSSSFSADSSGCGSHVCLASLLRLLHLEKRLSMRFSTDTKRLLHLTRLARNFAYALEHLHKFLESVLGPLPLASHIDGTSGSCQYLRECIEETKVFLEKCNYVGRTPVAPRLECRRGNLQDSQALAQFRLRMVGVAFFGGALRRTQWSLPVTVTPSSFSDNFRAANADHSSTISEALLPSRWGTRCEFTMEQAGLHHSSCCAVPGIRLANETFRNSIGIAGFSAGIVQSLPPPFSSKASPTVCKEATSNPEGLSKSHTSEHQDKETHMLQEIKEFIGPLGNHDNGESGARSESRNTGRKLQEQGMNGLDNLRNTAEEGTSAHKDHETPLYGAAPQFASRSFGGSEAPCSSTSAERRGNISQQFSWHKRPGFVSLLKTTREKLNSASTVIFSRYYGIERPSQSAFTKGSRKATSTFGEKHTDRGVGRRNLRPLPCSSTTRNRFQSLIERVGKRSCRGIVRQWVGARRCESPASPQSRGRSLRQRQCEVPPSHRNLSASPRGVEGNSVVQKECMQMPKMGP